MKYIVAALLATAIASPAFAGGASHGSTGGAGLIGSVVAPITTAVSALNVNALNNVSVLNGNKTNVSAIVPVSTAIKNVGVLNGLLGGSSGCGCR